MAATQGRIITIGVTGASGAILAQKTLTLLEDDPRVSRVHLVVTETGQRLFAEELGITSGDLKKLPHRILGRTPRKIVPISSLRRSFSITSAERATRSSLMPVAIDARAPMVHGITIMASTS
jgi:3-polyprenyl-4-hydroxybenzoate decarboxylase